MRRLSLSLAGRKIVFCRVSTGANRFVMDELDVYNALIRIE